MAGVSQRRPRDGGPEDGRPQGLAARAAWLVVAAAGLWALALGLVAGLAFLGYAILAYAPEHTFAAFAAWGIGFALAYGFMPRLSFRKATDEPPPLGPHEHPRLQAFVRDVAAQAEASGPDALYLMYEANAFAGRRRPRLLARTRSIVGMGLPVLARMTEDEARSVLAHEMGHHVAGDVRLGPWVHGTRRAVAAAVDRLEGSSFWLHLPFIAYADFFLKHSLRISRAQELAADAMAARVAGAGAAASALRKMEVLGAAWRAYAEHEVLPVLGHGVLPPLLDGFEIYWRAAQTPGTPAFEALGADLEAGQRAHAHDTHPTLDERLHALGDPPPTTEAKSPALGLLDDVAAVEEKVLRALLRDPKMPLRRVAWDAMGHDVWLPLWRETLGPHASVLQRFRIAELPQVMADWQRVADSTRRGPAIASPLAERRRVVHFVGVWLAVALADSGFRIDAAPGRAVAAEREGRVLEPFALVRAMDRAPDGEAWARVCAEHGL
jgi:Zn-dependent protease with chaperone function